MATLTEDRLANETFYETVLSGTDQMMKQAENVVNDYVRLMLREDGAFRKILPLVKITDAELDRQVGTSSPAKVVDMEINSPAAITAPFRKGPNQCYIHGQRFLVTFARILSPWFSSDVNELRTHVMDIRQVMSDNSLKDMLAEEDLGGLAAVNAIMGGAQGVAGTFTGVQQWQSIPSAISRVALTAGTRIMPTMGGHLHPERALINNYSIYDLYNWGRDEMGGDLSQDIIRNGWTIKNFCGMEWIVTIKRNLVPDGTIYFFGNPQFMGKFYSLDETVMYIERKNFMISWFCYGCIGLTLANPYPFVRVDYQD